MASKAIGHKCIFGTSPGEPNGWYTVQCSEFLPVDVDTGHGMRCCLAIPPVVDTSGAARRCVGGAICCCQRCLANCKWEEGKNSEISRLRDEAETAQRKAEADMAELRAQGHKRKAELEDETRVVEQVRGQFERQMDEMKLKLHEVQERGWMHSLNLKAQGSAGKTHGRNEAEAP